MPNRQPKVAVFGSINMDVVIRCGHLPAPGETIIADSSTEVSGGKGANQAVAASRLGAAVAMIGSVGDDVFADRLLSSLEAEKIDISHVTRRSNCGSGLAVVAVDDSGENSILVVPGANGALTVEDVRAATEVICASDTLLLQLEVPIEAVLAAIHIAKQGETRVILDPAPALNEFPADLLAVDLVCPNQSEAAHILGREIDSLAAAREAANELAHRGAKNAIITLGDRGAVVCDGKTTELVRPFTIKPVDTTASGDAFAGAIAVCWTEQTMLVEAARFASAAGAISATRLGAQPGLPTLAEVKQLANNSR
jgi:ribokinase